MEAEKIYIHVLEPPGPSIALPKPATAIRSAYSMKDHSLVQFAENEFGLLLKLPAHGPEEFDQIVVLETQ